MLFNCICFFQITFPRFTLLPMFHNSNFSTSRTHQFRFFGEAAFAHYLYFVVRFHPFSCRCISAGIAVFYRTTAKRCCRMIKLEIVFSKSQMICAAFCIIPIIFLVTGNFKFWEFEALVAIALSFFRKVFYRNFNERDPKKALIRMLFLLIKSYSAFMNISLISFFCFY